MLPEVPVCLSLIRRQSSGTLSKALLKSRYSVKLSFLAVRWKKKIRKKKSLLNCRSGQKTKLDIDD